MLFHPCEGQAAGRSVSQPPHCVSDLPNDLPKEEQIKARLRQLTEDSRRLRDEIDHLIRYQPDHHRSFAHDHSSKLRKAYRRRKPR
jgi:hypothetical protein